MDRLRFASNSLALWIAKARADLEQEWRTASSVIGGRSLIVDMTFVTCLHEEAKALLARWHRDGAQIVAKSTLATRLAEEAIGEPSRFPIA
jgi:hypothetical protein